MRELTLAFPVKCRKQVLLDNKEERGERGEEERIEEKSLARIEYQRVERVSSHTKTQNRKGEVSSS